MNTSRTLPIAAIAIAASTLMLPAAIADDTLSTPSAEVANDQAGLKSLARVPSANKTVAPVDNSTTTPSADPLPPAQPATSPSPADTTIPQQPQALPVPTSPQQNSDSGPTSDAAPEASQQESESLPKADEQKPTLKSTQSSASPSTNSQKLAPLNEIPTAPQPEPTAATSLGEDETVRTIDGNPYVVDKEGNVVARYFIPANRSVGVKPGIITESIDTKDIGASKTNYLIVFVCGMAIPIVISWSRRMSEITKNDSNDR